MTKKLLGILTVITIMFSCGNKEQKKDACCDKEIATITVDKVITDMQKFIDKSVVIAGTVNHVCSHGGKRLFIIGENPDIAIKITPCEEIGVFEKELEGSHVLVTGIVKELRIDETYVANLEKELKEGFDNEAVHDHSAGTHDEEEEENEKNAQIEAMRTQISESENGYYSQYWIEASKFEVKECDHDHAEKADSKSEDHEHAEGEHKH